MEVEMFCKRPCQQNKSMKTNENQSKHVLTDSEELILMKDLNYSAMTPYSNLDMTCCRICCSEASTDSGHGIQVADQVHVREAQHDYNGAQSRIIYEAQQ
jgi:hypothetical protein